MINSHLFFYYSPPLYCDPVMLQNMLWFRGILYRFVKGNFYHCLIFIFYLRFKVVSFSCVCSNDFLIENNLIGIKENSFSTHQPKELFRRCSVCICLWQWCTFTQDVIFWENTQKICRLCTVLLISLYSIF